MPATPLDVLAELRLVPGLADVRSDLLAELARGASDRAVHANVSLVTQGKLGGHLIALVRGAAKIVRKADIDHDDHPVVIDVMRAPFLVVDVSLFDNLPATASVITLRASHIVSIDRSVVADLLPRYPVLAQVLLARAAHELRGHTRRIDELVSGSVEGRVKHLLESLARAHGTPLGQGRFIALPLRRRDIACMVNATTETVSRLLAKFERDGLARSTRDGIWWRSFPKPMESKPTSASPPLGDSSLREERELKAEAPKGSSSGMGSGST